MLRKKSNGVAIGPRSSSFIGKTASKIVDRRAFLRGSGLAVGGIAAVTALSGNIVKPAMASAGSGSVSHKKSVCTHCSVGCTVMAEVQDGVWTGQEPGWDSPFNLGAHCAKGASVRETAQGERRLKYPMKLVNGEWTKVSWDTAIDEIGEKMLKIREESGPDSVYWLGSAKTNNEQSYLFRKFAEILGSIYEKPIFNFGDKNFRAALNNLFQQGLEIKEVRGSEHFIFFNRITFGLISILMKLESNIETKGALEIIMNKEN